MRIKIDVTQEDIRRGKTNQPQGCPVYRAAQRALKDINRVGLESIGNIHSSFDLPRKAQVWILQLDIDGKKAVQPFSFTLNVPKQYVKGK